MHDYEQRAAYARTNELLSDIPNSSLRIFSAKDTPVEKMPMPAKNLIDGTIFVPVMGWLHVSREEYERFYLPSDPGFRDR